MKASFLKENNDIWCWWKLFSVVSREAPLHQYPDLSKHRMRAANDFSCEIERCVLNGHCFMEDKPLLKTIFRLWTGKIPNFSTTLLVNYDSATPNLSIVLFHNTATWRDSSIKWHHVFKKWRLHISHKNGRPHFLKKEGFNLYEGMISSAVSGGEPLYK